MFRSDALRPEDAAALCGRDKERMYMESYFKVGIVTAPHGVGGEVKVYPTTDDVKRFGRLREVIFLRENLSGAVGGQGELPEPEPDASSPVLRIEAVKYLKQFAVLKFQGIDSVEDARRYCKGCLFVPRENAVRLKKDEYFIADLIGLEVRDEDGSPIGRLKDVLETGANDVYVISLKDGREFLLPAIKQCVLEVDIEAGFVRIHILEGLL